MRVTFVLAGSYGLSGGDRVIANFAKQLYARGYTVNLIARPRRPRPWYKPWKQHPQPLRESHFDQLPMPRRVLERYRPVTDADVPEADVIVATWWETAEWIAALSRDKGAKAYLIQHHETFDYLPQERAAATYRLPLHKLVVARWLQELMQKEYGDTCVSRIRMGIDHAQFHAPPRAKQPIPTIGFIYSRTAWKGAEVIRQTIRQVNAFCPPCASVPLGLTCLRTRCHYRLRQIGTIVLCKRSCPRSMRAAMYGCAAVGAKGLLCRQWRHWHVAVLLSRRGSVLSTN